MLANILFFGLMFLMTNSIVAEVPRENGTVNTVANDGQSNLVFSTNKTSDGGISQNTTFLFSSTVQSTTGGANNGPNWSLFFPLLISSLVLLLIIIVGMFYGCCCMRPSGNIKDGGSQVDLVIPNHTSVPVIKTLNPTDRKNKALANPISSATFTSCQTKQSTSSTKPSSGVKASVLKGQFRETVTNPRAPSQNVPTLVKVTSTMNRTKPFTGPSGNGSYFHGKSLEPPFFMRGAGETIMKEEGNSPQTIDFGREEDLEGATTEPTNSSQPVAIYRTSLFIIPTDPDDSLSLVQSSGLTLSKYEGLV